MKYGAGTAWELQVRTKRGWSFLREFNCHEAIRGWLTTNRIAVDDIRFGQFVPALLIMELI